MNRWVSHGASAKPGPGAPYNGVPKEYQESIIPVVKVIVLEEVPGTPKDMA